MVTPKFNAQDDVIVEWNGMWYIARVLSVEVRGNVPHYYVHFQRWNAKYDSWVEEHRVVEKSPANEKSLKAGFGLNVKQILAEKAGAEKEKKTATKDAPGVKKRTPSAPRVKRAATVVNDSTVEMDDSTDDPQDFPGYLKRRLVDDWEQITRRSLLVPLPCNPTVHTILNTYVTSRTATLSPQKAAVTKEVCTGIEGWFNASLHTSLLYNFERPQYFDEVSKHPGKKSSEIYGVEHLIRMLSRMSQILDSTHSLSKEDRDTVERVVRDFTKYIVESGESWFTKEYQITDKEYFSHVAECNARIQQALTAAKLKHESTVNPVPSHNSAIVQSTA